MTHELTLATLNEVGCRWLPIMLDAAVKGTAVLAVAGLVLLAMRRTSAAARQLVLLVALVGLLVVPITSLAMPGWATIKVLPAWARVEAPAGPAGAGQAAEVEPVEAESSALPVVAGDPATNPELPAMSDTAPASLSPDPQAERLASAGPPLQPAESPMDPARADAGDLPGRAALPPAGAATSAGPSPRTWIGWAMLAWMTGAAVCLLPLVLGRLSIWRLRRQAVPVTDGPLWEELTRAKLQLGLKGQVALFIGHRRPMPMMWGILRPALLLPAEAMDWSAQRVSVVMLHELGHVKRRDMLTKVLAHLAVAFYWFNPLVWLAYRRFQTEAERACDDLVLAAGSNAGEYAEHILDIASGLQTQLFAAHGSIAMARPNRLEGRLLAILDPRRSRRKLSLLLVLLALVVGASILIPLSALRARAEADKSESGAQNLTAASQPEDLAAIPAPSSPVTDEEIDVLIDGLALDGQEAYDRLVAMGKGAIPRVAAAANKSEHRRVRWRCVEVLGAIQSPEVVAPLIEALKDRDKDVRRYAAGFLGQPGRGGEKTTTALTAMLADESTEVIWHAAYALGAQGQAARLRNNQILFDRLCRDLESPDRESRIWAAEVLAMAGEPQAIRPMIAALKAEQGRARKGNAPRAIARSVAQIQSPETALQLLAVCKDETLDAATRATAAEALPRLADAALTPEILKLLDKPSDITVSLLRSLGFAGNKAAIPKLAGLLADPASAAGIREEAARSLGRIGHGDVVRPLAGALTDASYRVRAAAVIGLGNVNAPGAADALLRATDDPSPTVVSWAVCGLGRLKHMPAVPVIVKLFDRADALSLSASSALSNLATECHRGLLDITGEPAPPDGGYIRDHAQLDRVKAAWREKAKAAAATQGENGNTIEVSLFAERDSIFVGEPMALWILIRNRSDRPVVVPTSFYTGEYLHLKTSVNGRATTETFAGPVGPSLFGEDGKELKPSEAVRVAAAFFTRPFAETPGEMVLQATLQSPGTYPRWRYVGDRREESPVACWAGKVASRPLTITVKPLTQPDDIAAWDEVRSKDHGYGWYATLRASDDERFTTVLTKFPRSIFARHATLALAQAYGRRCLNNGPYYDETVEHAKRVIEKYDPFWLTDDAHLLLAEVYLQRNRQNPGDKARAEAFRQLQLILRDWPESDSAWRAAELLKQVAPNGVTPAATQPSATTITRQKLLNANIRSLELDFIPYGRLPDGANGVRLLLTSRRDIEGVEAGKWPWNAAARLGIEDAQQVIVTMADAGWLDAAAEFKPGTRLEPDRQPGYVLLFGVLVGDERQSFRLELGWGQDLLDRLAPLQAALPEHTKAGRALEVLIDQQKAVAKADAAGKPAPPPTQGEVMDVKAAVRAIADRKSIAGPSGDGWPIVVEGVFSRHSPPAHAPRFMDDSAGWLVADDGQASLPMVGERLNEATKLAGFRDGQRLRVKGRANLFAEGFAVKIDAADAIAAATQPAAPATQGDEWGPAVQGVQVRIVCAKQVWQPDEVPAFGIRVRNMGKKTWRVGPAPPEEVLVDGRLYTYRGEYGESWLNPVRPGETVGGWGISLRADQWMDAGGRPLKSSRGRHHIAAQIRAHPARAKEDPLTLKSNTLIIEIAAEPPTTQADVGLSPVRDYAATICRATALLWRGVKPSAEEQAIAAKAFAELRQDKEGVTAFIIAELQKGDKQPGASDTPSRLAAAMGAVLGDFGEPYVRKVDPIILESKQADVRQNGILVLVQCGSQPWAADKIAEVLEREKEPTVQAVAIQAIRGRRHDELVASFLKSKSPAVRRAAIGHFWENSPGQHQPKLEELLKDETDRSVGFFLAWTLARQPGFRVEPLISDPRPGIRHGAIYGTFNYAREDMKSPAIEQAVLRQLAGEKDPLCQFDIARFLANKHDPRCIPILIALLATGDRTTTHPYEGADIATKCHALLWNLTQLPFEVSHADRAKARDSGGNIYAGPAAKFENWWNENKDFIRYDPNAYRFVVARHDKTIPNSKGSPATQGETLRPEATDVGAAFLILHDDRYIGVERPVTVEGIFSLKPPAGADRPAGHLGFDASGGFLVSDDGKFAIPVFGGRLAQAKKVKLLKNGQRLRVRGTAMLYPELDFCRFSGR